MSTSIEIDEAQSRLREIIAALHVGDEVVITEDDRPIARLKSEEPKITGSRIPGNCAGMITLTEDDDDHLLGFEEYLP